MKKLLFFVVVTAVMAACNNTSKDSVQKADSANEARSDSGNSTNKTGAISTDEASAEFLVRALDGGLMEVDLGSLAWQKARDKRVRDFGAMMVTDHESANAKIRNLAAARSVTLPEMTSDKMSKIIRGLAEKKSSDFDRKYINSMEEDHRKDIREFESAAKKVKDTAVHTFIEAMLPVLKKHLDSCMAIQQVLKEAKEK